MAVHSKPTAMPVMMLVAGPVCEASAISLHRTIFILRVVLGDVDKRLGHDNADDAAEKEIDPGRGRFRILAGSTASIHRAAKKKPTIARILVI